MAPITCIFEIILAENQSKTDLRPFSENDLAKFPEADKSCVLCTRCRKLVSQYNPPVENNDILTQVSLENLSVSQQPMSSGSSFKTISNFSDTLIEFGDHTIEKFLNVSPIQRKR